MGILSGLAKEENPIISIKEGFRSPPKTFIFQLLTGFYALPA
jgi:hypothetical protein